MTGDVTIHIRIRSYENIVTDADSAHYGRIGPDPNVVTNGRCTFPLSAILLTDGNAFVKIHIATDNSSCVYRNPITMSEVKTRADYGFWVYLESVSFPHAMKAEPP